MALLGDRVQETTTSTGTGSITLNGAVTGYVTFNSTFSNGDVVWYVIDDGAGNWEIGYGTVGTGTLTRTVFQSSNSNNLVSFGVGTKRIFCTAPYTYLLPDQTGNSGKILTTDGTTSSWVSVGTAGGVTAVSVATANGLAGTSSGGSTPALTLSTTVTGMLKGNGTAISAAVAGTDYAGLASANTFTNNQVISVSSASDALRITQTGTGNALVVEDSANPDATPFVVTKDGYVGIGTTSPTTGLSIVQDGSCQFNFIRNSDNVAPPYFVNIKRRGTEASKVIVNNNDQALSIQAYGYDGTADRALAYIDAFVDGTPGTNDMPGRLVFSTTADGASSPTERMRIDNAGRVGIGGTPAAYSKIVIDGTLPTSSGLTQAFRSVGTIPSGTTTTYWGYLSAPITQASAFTLATLRHFSAEPQSFTGGSTVTNQYGFIADYSLTGATNNYGFYSNIASGSGRYNFFAGGTADNYFAGLFGVKALPSAGINIISGGNYTGAVYSYGYYANGAFQSDVTNTGSGYVTALATQATAFTLTNMPHYWATQSTIGAGSAVTNQFGFKAESSLTGATNNFGFYSNIASGTGRYNFYAAGTADNYFAGNVGIGTTPAVNLDVYNATNAQIRASGSTVDLRVRADSSGSVGIVGTYSNVPLLFNTNSTERMWIDNAGRVGIGASPYAGAKVLIGGNATDSSTDSVVNLQTLQSSVTTKWNGFTSYPALAAGSYTLSTLRHFDASFNTIGAGAAITNQYGFSAGSSLTGATNNYGFYSNIASGTGRYNFYAAGTADNYFAGLVGVGTTTLGGYYGTLVVAGSGNPTGGYLEGIHSNMAIPSSVTARHDAFLSTAYTQAASFTLSSLNHYKAQPGTFGAGSTVTTQRGFFVDSDLTGATNNYGFYSNIASGTGRYNFYAAGTADNYLAGSLGIGATANAGQSVRIGGNITGATSSYSMVSNGSVQSDVTSSGYGFASIIGTQATTFTTTAVTQFMAKQGTFGAGSTVTNQYGFQVDSNLTGATNNFGFYSNIASGTGRWNFYAAGSAANYLGGDLTFKPLASATPANNGDLTFEATSNTSVKIKLKGSDGVVRSVTLTLA